MTFNNLIMFSMAIAIAGCANQSRQLASEQSLDGEVLELAQKLKGGTIRLRASAKDGKPSILDFLEVKFEDCQALVADKSSSDSRKQNDFINCRLTFGTKLLNSSVDAVVVGKKAQFKTHFSYDQDREIGLDVDFFMSYDTKKSVWRGDGMITGFINKHEGGLNIDATLRETLVR
jgi:hypothetical protein